MQLLPSSHDPTPHAELICRRGRWGLPVLVAILWSAPVVWWTLGAPLFLPIVCGLPAALLTIPILSTWHRRGQAANWTLALTPGQVLLNLRSGDHTYAEDFPSVLAVDRSEIREAVPHVRDIDAPGFDAGETTRYRQTSLDLRLFRALSDDVVEAVRRVRSDKLATRTYFGWITVTPRVTCLPVSVVDSTTLRVLWKGRGQSLRPGLTRVLDRLSRTVGIGEAVRVEAEDWSALDGEAFERYLAELAGSGRHIAAVKAARQKLDLPLIEAHALVERLTAGR